jgi:virginiamycin B lyase
VVTRARLESAAIAAVGALLVQVALVGVAVAAPTFNEFEIPTKDLAPGGIVSGPDGNLWFATEAKPGVGDSTTGGAISSYTSGFSNTTEGVTVGSDGNLWFTEPKAHKIVRVTTLGAATEYAVEAEPVEVAAGADGNLWFTEASGSGAIGRIDPSSGKVTEFSIGLTPNSKPTGIAAGPDGALWFTENAGSGAIGRITTTGTITEYRTGLTANSQPSGIAAGDDDALYFTEFSNPGRIGRISTAGSITEYPTTTANSQPAGIAPGPDGNMWFTEVGNHGKIGTITVAPGTSAAAATSVHEDVATLHAQVDPNSQATSYRFEYGTTAGYGQQTGSASAGSGASATIVSAPVSGLAPATTYHYRVVATNATGTTDGPDSTVTTLAAPVADTEPATGVGTGAATLTGEVNPNGQATTYHFEWGTSTAYGNQVPLADVGVGSGTTEVAVEQALGSLTPDTTYHYRLVATNCEGCAEGTAYGADQLFTTAPKPGAVTGGAEVTSPGSVTVAATVNPNGGPTTYHFDWGPTSAYGQREPATEANVGSDNTAHAVSQAITGLTPGATYHYRIVATNCAGCQAGTVEGNDATVTLPAPPSALLEPLPLGGGPLGAGPMPAAGPMLARTASAGTIAGTVTVRSPGGPATHTLSSAQDIPLGSLVDATHGVVQITTATDAHGHTQTATLWGGSFVVTQTVAGGGMTTMTLAGPLTCPARARRASVATAYSARARSRSLWARDNHGHFSTRGHNSVATVRGTYWQTLDTCAGTLTYVRQGAVSVRDRHRRRTVLVRAGHSYLARR